MKEWIAEAANVLQRECHDAAYKAGWWCQEGIGDIADWLKNDESFSPGNGYLQGAIVAQRLCLIHSEISEAMEGHRKNLMDDKLPHRKMIEVELADAVIRIFDLAGAMEMDLGGAIAEKMAFNETRADHKLEQRSAPGGKSY